MHFLAPNTKTTRHRIGPLSSIATTALFLFIYLNEYELFVFQMTHSTRLAEAHTLTQAQCKTERRNSRLLPRSGWDSWANAICAADKPSFASNGPLVMALRWQCSAFDSRLNASNLIASLRLNRATGEKSQIQMEFTETNHHNWVRWPFVRCSSLPHNLWAHYSPVTQHTYITMYFVRCL